MTDKEIKRLRRAELIEIIYEFQKNQDVLQSQVNSLRKALSERQIKIRESGSIAEAALKINEIFEKAQAAADQYLESIKNQTFDSHAVEANTDADLIERAAVAKAEQIVQDAQKRADAIINKAKAQQKEIAAQTDADVAEKWKEFKNDVETALKASPAPVPESKAIIDYLREMRSDDV